MAKLQGSQTLEKALSEILNEKRVKLDLPAAIANIRRKAVPSRVFHFEHGEEPGTQQALCDRFDLCEGFDTSDAYFQLRREIRIKQFLGQEFMRVFPGGIVWKGLPTSTTAPPPAVGPIQTWQDFETYPWPKINAVDFSAVEWYEKNLPGDIAMTAMTYLFQQVSNLIGFEPLCMMLYENRDLVKAVAQKVGEFFVTYTDTLCQFSRFGAIVVGDDMGHKTGTLISPNDLREIFIPWQKRLIATAQSYDRLGLFHTCGQVEAIMDDLIDAVGIDAKHSTQDVIEPVAVTKRRWGDRVALLGGVDVDFITRATPQQVRTYTRAILETCTPGGGFALGVGNWVADSMPLDNYLAMLTEARTFA